MTTQKSYVLWTVLFIFLFAANEVEAQEKDISSSPRIGVDYAGEDAKLPYRFYIKNNKWISK